MRNAPEWHSDDALLKYEKRTKKPLLAVSIVYLVIAFVEILPGFDTPLLLKLVDAGIMSVFVFDYFWRVLALAPDPKHYWYQWPNPLDILVIVTYPFVVLGYGVAGFTRAFRMVATLARFSRAGAMAGKTLDGAHRVFAKRSVAWMGPLIILLAGLVTVYIWRTEYVHHSKSLADSGRVLWWGIDMLMTGDSNDSPFTTEAHALSVVIALLGIALFGLLTAWLAAAFVENDEVERDEEARQTLDEVTALRKQVTQMQQTVASLERMMRAGGVDGDDPRRLRGDGRPTRRLTRDRPRP